MAHRLPIVTSFGMLRGRDCVYLDRVIFEDGTNTLLLEGSINGNLCTVQRKGEFLPYVLRFRGVLAMKMIELDSWDCDSASSFDEVKESKWISSLSGKVTVEHRHFALLTYDDVFEIVCSEYELEIGRVAV